MGKMKEKNVKNVIITILSTEFSRCIQWKQMFSTLSTKRLWTIHKIIKIIHIVLLSFC